MGLIEKVVKEAKKIHSLSKGSHGWEHTLRVYKLAVRIAKKEKACLETVKLAALLHDVARAAEDNSGGKKDHAAEGARMAARILAKYKVDPGKISRICGCIETHRFRSDKKPASIEARALFDADKLDSIGAAGIGRAFLFAGEVGAKLHNRGIDFSKTRPYTAEDTAYREYMVKLRHVKSRMLTNEGRKLAKERHAYMAGFFRRLDREVEGKI